MLSGRFFGPNGAGKTTLISAVCNLIRITDGQARVFRSPRLRPRGATSDRDRRARPNLDRFLTVRETLVYHGGYLRDGEKAAEERAERMIDVFDLRPKRDVRAPKLTGGMRRRLLADRGPRASCRWYGIAHSQPGIDALRHRALMEAPAELAKLGT